MSAAMATIGGCLLFLFAQLELLSAAYSRADVSFQWERLEQWDLDEALALSATALMADKLLSIGGMRGSGTYHLNSTIVLDCNSTRCNEGRLFHQTGRLNRGIPSCVFHVW